MTDFPQKLRNAAGRPIELHAADGSVRILSPGEVIVLDAPDMTCAQLIQSGALTRHSVPPPKPKPAPKPKRKRRTKPAAKAAPKAKPKPKSTRKTKPKTNARTTRAKRTQADEPGGSS